MGVHKRLQPPKVDTFGFVLDKKLRADIEDVLNFSSYLVIAASRVSDRRYKEEFYRVIVLYVASIVEALCMYLIAHKKIPLEKLEYKSPQVVRIMGVQVEGGELVVAKRCPAALNTREIPFVEAIRLLKGKRIISSSLQKSLNSLRSKRNSQHLYGRRDDGITRKDVGFAFDALAKLQEQAAHELR